MCRGTIATESSAQIFFVIVDEVEDYRIRYARSAAFSAVHSFLPKHSSMEFLALVTPTVYSTVTRQPNVRGTEFGGTMTYPTTPFT